VAAVNDLIKGAVECDMPRPQFAYMRLSGSGEARNWGLPGALQSAHLGGQAQRVRTDRQAAGRTEGVGVRAQIILTPFEVFTSDGVFMDEFGDFKPSVWGKPSVPPCLIGADGQCSGGRLRAGTSSGMCVDRPQER